MLKMVDGTGIIGVDMVCPLGGAVSPPQPPNYDKVEVEGVGSLMLPNSLKAPLERVELIGNSTQFTTTGAQLTPLSQDNLYNKDGLTAVMNPDGSVNIIGTPTKQFASVMAIEIIGLEAGTYYISGGSINDGKIVYQCNVIRADGSREYFSNRLMELKSDDQYRLYLLTYNSSNLTEVNDTIYPMLNKGSKALPFEPYTGGNPSPSPEYPQEIKSVGKKVDEKYLLDLKITGKNLLNVSSEAISGKNAYGKYNIQDGVITFNTINNWGGDYIYFNSIDVGNNKDLIFRGDATLPENPSDIGRGCRILVIAYDKNGALLTDVDTIFAEKSYQWIYNEYYKGFISNNRINEGLSAKLTDEVDKITVGVSYSNTAADYPVRISDVQVEYGTVNTEYEPYTEQSVQIALDEPLRGVGEYKDMFTKDGVTRKIKKIALDGSEGWLIDKIVEGNVTQTFVLILKDMLLISNHDKRIMCDKFKFGTALWANDIVAIGTYSNKLYLNVEKDKAPDLQTFKTWLSQNPLAVDYVLAEPVTEPLPESVQAQLQALHSENGTTHVFVDSGEVPCGIKLTYRKEI
jgi:hypothetical protein